MPRPDGRDALQLRPLQIECNPVKYPEGSALISTGDTRVLCTASLQDSVPGWLRGQGRGWIKAEYSMLPRATAQRTPREATRGRQSGRTMEIQRIIGRALRAGVDLEQLGERTLWIDCDVLQADAGTRTASVTGGYVAMALALAGLVRSGAVEHSPLRDFVAAVSVGCVDGEVRLDLDYAEDSAAQVDLNVVATGDGRLVEVQGTAEGDPIERALFDAMLSGALEGIGQLVAGQRRALGADVQFIGGSAAGDETPSNGAADPSGAARGGERAGHAVPGRS